MKKENIDRKSIIIRVSPELKFQIEKSALKNNLTINGWIVDAIKKQIER